MKTRSHSSVRAGIAGSSWPLCFIVMAACFLTSLAVAANPSTTEDEACCPNERVPVTGRWCFFSGNVNNQPHLRIATRMIDRQINGSFRLLAPGFSDVDTFADQRDDMMIWTAFMGVGKVVSKRWELFVQAGYSEGKVITRATDWSLLLLPLHSDVEIKRGNFFTGVGATFYPWGGVELGKYASLKDRLRHAKPFLSSTFHWNYFTFDAKVKGRLLPLPNLIDVKQGDSWNPWSIGLVTGIDIPVTRSSALALNAQYNFFLDQSEDFSGPGYAVLWKHYF